VESALDELSPDYRAVLVLRAHENLSYAEIAATLEIPVGTVMSRLSRARIQVRNVLAARGVALPEREEEA
jgi:RNA polymerase sigma factor (sigma-70 family)